MYHALFCPTRVKKKRGCCCCCFPSKLAFSFAIITYTPLSPSTEARGSNGLFPFPYGAYCHACYSICTVQKPVALCPPKPKQQLVPYHPSPVRAPKELYSLSARRVLHLGSCFVRVGGYQGVTYKRNITFREKRSHMNSENAFFFWWLRRTDDHLFRFIISNSPKCWVLLL